MRRLSFADGGHVSRGSPLDLEGPSRGVACFFVEERVDRIVPSKTFDFDLEPEIVGAVGIDQGLFERNPFLLIQLEQDVVERLAAFLHSLLHRFLEQIDLGFLDEILNPRRIEHDFQRWSPLPVHGWNKPLRDDGPKIERQLEIDLCMSLHREKIHDAFDGLVRVVRVERADAEVSGFREGDRGFHRFRVPDFADQNHIRRLPQGILERILK